RQRFARLLAEGLYDPDRKRPLPRYPRRIVVVSSPTGAAVRDFLQVTGRRWRAAEILIAPSRVQGAGAAEEVAAAIEMANRVAGARFRLDDAAADLDRAARRGLDVRRNHLARLAAKLESLSPLGVLARGYSLAFAADAAGEAVGPPLRRAQDVVPGDRIVVR